ncbi:hypothetical protein PIB30_097046 [Stylosanthes scabra]|uniref:Uncharacterized protein n=1 Tax=Stylosanthes scabra TaxID=79078 RepID=A0ABU6YVG8_9FABA|nr:hypothetical protein [Stylosanthes scabra]
MFRRTNQIVVRLYPNRFPRKGPDGVESHSLDPVVFMMWSMETLGDLQKTILSNIRLQERTPVIRMAYRFFAVLPDRSCRYKVFWLINDENVRAMFASHGRILSDQVMDLYVQILDTRTSTPGAGTSYPEPEVQAPMTANPVDVDRRKCMQARQSPMERIQVTLKVAVLVLVMTSLWGITSWYSVPATCTTSDPGSMGSGVIYYEYKKHEKFKDYDEKVDAELEEEEEEEKKKKKPLLLLFLWMWMPARIIYNTWKSFSVIPSTLPPIVVRLQSWVHHPRVQQNNYLIVMTLRVIIFPEFGNRHHQVRVIRVPPLVST